jgi:hypothetical protein
MCKVVEVGSVVLFAGNVCDRRTGARIGIVKSKLNRSMLIVAAEGALVLVPQRKCLVLRGK